MKSVIIESWQQNKPLLTLLLSFAITFFLLPRLGKLASRIGLIDFPERRKIHRKPRPLVGGIAMSLAVAVSGLLFIPLGNLRGFYAGSVLLVITGFLDDFNEISHQYKFFVEIISAVFVMYFSNVYLYTFGDLLSFGPINFSFSVPIITAIGIVGVCNSINMIDGIDGLAGGLCLASFASFAFLSFLDHDTTLLLISLAICGSLVAFLIFNWHPSKLFMGDAGSIFLGFSAAFISIALTQHGNSLVKPVVPLLILTVPIVDTFTVIIKRLITGKNPFHPDRAHFHHMLLRLRYGQQKAAGSIIIVSSFFCSVAIAGTLLPIPEYYLFALFLIYFISYLAVSFFVRDDNAERSWLN